MSIIQDALRKAEAYADQYKLKVRRAPAPTSPASPAEPRRSLAPGARTAFTLAAVQKKYLIIGGVLIGIIGIAAVIISMVIALAPKRAQPAPAPEVSAQVVSYKPLAVAVPPPTPAALPQPSSAAPVSTPLAQKPMPKLVLNGIMYLATAPKAIINDMVVGEGDEIEGAKIVKITRTTVVAECNDVEITLSLKY